MRHRRPMWCSNVASCSALAFESIREKKPGTFRYFTLLRIEGLRFYNVDNAAEKEDDVAVIAKLNAVFGRARISISACV